MSNVSILEKKILLKELVDKIAILGDIKDFDSQVLLFSQNAIIETVVEGKSILKLLGRKEIVEAFKEFHQDIESAYHFNGPHTIILNENSASGTLYCLITLISYENSKWIKTSIGAIYEDEYTYEKNQWNISKRITHFKWRDKKELTF